MDEQRLTFTEHLEELRRRILICALSIALCSLAAYYYSDLILHHLAKPVGQLVFLSPAEAFLSKLKISVYAGLILSMPVTLFEAWQFTVIALKPKEKRALFWILPSAYFLFCAGSALALFVVNPIAIQFLMSYGSKELTPLLGIGAYLGFILTLTLSFGLLFQLPLALFFLNAVGIVNRLQLVSARKIVYVASFVVAAVMTPGPDIFSQILLAVPTICLYELSLILMRGEKRATK